MYAYTSNGRINRTNTYSIVNLFTEDAHFVYETCIKLGGSREMALQRVVNLYGPSVTAIVAANNK